ncbi:MAG: DNA repair protein RadA [Gemmatimonadota bacterium]
MKTARTAYFCTSCGNETLRWEGRCPGCGEWNSLAKAPVGARSERFTAKSGAVRRPGLESKPEALGDGPATPLARTQIGFGDFDRVLGGGLVPGSVILLGGAPGIGKSTLMLQAAARMAVTGKRVLYASGEESREQIKLRAARVGASTARVLFISTTDLSELLKVVESDPPDLLLVDSIQTLVASDSTAAAGGVKQVQESAALLLEVAKRYGFPTFLIGHVTKGGQLAGPRSLEHLVDVVLLFEGQRLAEQRWLRSVKNRFGSVDELAAYRMAERGLEPLTDPSAIFVNDRPAEVSGAAICVPLQGRRPVLAEVQALSAPARFSTPQRVATGFPPRRLAVLLAVLERKAGLPLTGKDVFLSVVGGLRLVDPSADLGVLAALVSAELDRPPPAAAAFVGEVGLSGELRGVPQCAARVRVAVRAGLSRIVLPAAARDEADWGPEIQFAEHVREVVAWLRA